MNLLPKEIKNNILDNVYFLKHKQKYDRCLREFLSSQYEKRCIELEELRIQRNVYHFAVQNYNNNIDIYNETINNYKKSMYNYDVSLFLLVMTIFFSFLYNLL